MESKSFIALIVLAVAVLGNCTAVDRQLRKMNNRINNKMNEMQENINEMKQNIADLEFENRELRKELEGEKNRTDALGIKLDSTLSRSSPAITDSGSKDSTVREELQKVESVVNRLAKDVAHLKSRPYESTNQLEVSFRKAFGKEKQLVRKLNETLQSKQEVAMKGIHDFIAKSNASLERHIEDTTSKYEETILQLTTKVDKLITAMANTDRRMSQNERLLTAVSDCGSHKDIPNGHVSGDTSVGGTPVISCNNGYSQTGSAQCEVPVMWKTDVKCQKDCAILHVAKGMVNPATTVPHGTPVTVTCNSDYDLVGTSTAVCNNGDFTGVPSCRRRIPTFTDMVVGSSRSFNVRLDDDNTVPWISGSEFLSDGRLVLCDHYNDRLKLLSSDFTMLDSLLLQSKPWDVSAVNSTTVIVTIPYRKLLQYVYVLPHFSKSSKIQLDKTCWGVDVVGDEIFTSCFNTWNTYDGEVTVYDLSGTLKRQFGVNQDKSYMFIAPYYLTVSSNTGNIYVSDKTTDIVTCLSSAGDVIYQYDDPELDYPAGVYLDHADNSIVLGGLSHNAHVVTASSTKHRILLTSSTQDPYSVAYRQSDSTLVIGSYNKNLLVFKLEN